MAQQVSFEGGWVQKPRHLLQPGELVDAVNVVPTDPGALQTRLGDVLYNTTDQLDVHSLYTTYRETQALVTYQSAGPTLYRNFTSIVTGLNGTPLTFASLRGFGEQKTYTFFAGNQDALRIKDDGVTLTRWGIAPPTTTPFVGAAGTGGLVGTYGWAQTFVRKPLVASHAGGWTNATTTYTEGTPFAVSTASISDGFLVGGERLYADVRLSLSVAASAGGVYEYSYWNGQGWVLFTPTLPTGFPIFQRTGLSWFGLTFPSSDWPKAVPTGTFTSAALPALYWVRVRATTPPGTAGTVQTVWLYDSNVAARSVPSPITAATVQGATTDRALTLANPSTGANLDPQVTHVEVYRTRGDDPNVTAALPSSTWALYFEAEQPAGETAFRSFIADKDLDTLEIMETDNNRPLAFRTITDHQDRLFGAVDNRLYFSKRFLPESFPLSNYVEVSTLGDPIQAIAQYDGNLYIWTAMRVYLLLGSDETSYDPRQLQCPTGLAAVGSVARGEKGVYFLGSDGNLWRLQGATVAVNLTHMGHYAFFHQVTYNAVPPLNQLARSTCVGCWFNNRYYFSYPTGTATTPNAMLFIDENTDTWWRDSRGFRSLYYDRRSDAFFGGTTVAQVYLLESSPTDHGTAVTWFVVTRDEDEGQGDQEKDLVQVAVDALTNSLTLAVVAVRDYGSTPQVVLGTVTTSTRQEVIVSGAAAGSPQAKAFGYLLSGSGPMIVYRLFPHVLLLPTLLTTYDSLPTTLGWPGPKLLESLLLDLDLRTGTVHWELYADSALADAGVLATLGRQLAQLLTAVHRGTTFQLFLRGTGTFLLYPGSVLQWQPEPTRVQAFDTLALNLGWPGLKLLESLLLDVQVESGTLTMEVLVDGVVVETETVGVGRSQLQMLHAPQTGTLVQVRLHGTGIFQVYPGSVIGWRRLPAPLWTDAMVPQDLGTAMQKVGLAYMLDLELLSPGVVTTDFYVDGVQVHRLQTTELGRHRSQRHRLPEAMVGRLFAVRRTSTAPYLLWSGTDLEWIPFGGTQRQHYRQVEPLGEAQATPLQQAALPSGLQTTPLPTAA
jgi:hypothetical protein